MSYEQVQLVSQLIAAILFFGVLVGVAIYAFRPGNGKRFEQASKLPLESDHPTKFR